MRRLNEFRLYYNHTIYPELLRLERKRKQLLLLLFASIFIVIAVFSLGLYLNILSITLSLLLPIGFYITYLLYRIQQFRATFKPHVVNLLLDFIDDSLNFGTLKYDAKRFIPKPIFLASQIFATDAPFYLGEDYIEGKIGELDFELCELNVKEYSKVRSRLNYVFRGILLHATFKKPMKGAILILPRKFRQYLSRTIRLFNRLGGKSVDHIHNTAFEEIFMTYATPDSDYMNLLSEDMQESILDFRDRTGKEIYVSFKGNEIYIAVTEPKDILEPFIFKSNISFALIREFFEEIQLLLTIIEDFDANH
ncbi:MAG: DUF3137 domain-containing protein [Saprospiraceae bacterium]